MKKFLSTTAVALAMSTATYADTYSSAFSDQAFDPAHNVNASEMIGMRVYASEADISADVAMPANGETEWDDIGEINEILLTRDGEVQSVIVGVGGFLGIGEKDVAVNMSEIRFVEEDGENDGYFLVIKANKVGVTEAPAYEYSETPDRLGHNTEMGNWSGPSVEMDGFDRVASDVLTTEDLTGAPVMGVNDEEVGEIGKLLLTAEGKLDRAVIDVGGFLGMGEHEVAVQMDKLTILRKADGSDLRVYIDASEETLKQQSEYEG